MAKNKIIVPFIYSDPQVGRVAFPLIGFVWTVFLVILALLIVGIIHSLFQANESSNGLSFILLLIAFCLALSFIILKAFLEEYICDHIIIKEKHLILKNSKILLGGKEKTYQIGQDSKIVWLIERKKIKYTEARYNKLIFYDIINSQNILIQKFSIGRGNEKSWIRFLNILHKVSNLKIEKEELQT